VHRIAGCLFEPRSQLREEIERCFKSAPRRASIQIDLTFIGFDVKTEKKRKGMH
jgi:hypothetical protein